jgi:hypothetical protein
LSGGILDHKIVVEIIVLSVLAEMGKVLD